MTTTVVELYAGLAAWTLHLHGERPPASRIGAKTGYAAEISNALRVRGVPKRVVLVEVDPQLANALQYLLHQPRQLASSVAQIRESAGPIPREVWRAAKLQKHEPTAQGAAAWWIWTAGARGGIGGYKGRHKLRPNVDGFIPSLDALEKRISLLRPHPNIEIICGRAESIAPIPGAVVYIDPPYVGTQGYVNAAPDLQTVCAIARRWSAAGCRVAVSYNRPLAREVQGCLPGWRDVDLSALRRGQCRRSLTRSAVEWLVLSPTPGKAPVRWAGGVEVRRPKDKCAVRISGGGDWSAD